MTPRALIAVLAALLLVLGGCAGGPEELEPGPDGAAGDLPEWITTVSPVPGAVAAPTDLIEVQHEQRGEQTSVRIFIDGVDVTTYAVPNEGTNTEQPFGEVAEGTNQGEGLLAYDPNTEDKPVGIDPGTHTVLLQRVRYEEFGGDWEVLDEFEYTFTVR